MALSSSFEGMVRPFNRAMCVIQSSVTLCMSLEALMAEFIRVKGKEP
jgi:hypothetical protein